MRKLASIQRIKALESIADADKIEKATVLGWQLVVKKGEHNVGDLVVYCEIDSLLPDKPEFEFLKPRGMRIRTIRLRGQVSQGICFPLSILPLDFEIEEDKDCTEVLGIEKYEPPTPASLSGIAKGEFPSFIPKTDETRIQVLQPVLDEYEGEECCVTEKLDGSSTTYYIRDGKFGVCSRNLELIETPENTLWKVAREWDIEGKLHSLNRNIALQGEMVGEGIQSNRLKLRGQKVLFFNAFDIDKYEYLSFSEFKVLLQELELPIVPVISENYRLENNIESLVKMATRKSLIQKDAWAEGIIIRPLQNKENSTLPSKYMNSGRVSFKAINPEFLLKHGD